MGSYERAPWGGRGLSGLEEEEARRSFRRRVSIVAGAVVAVAVLAGGSAAWLTAGRAWQLGGEVAALRGQNAQLQGQLGQARGQLATATAELSQERAADARAEGDLETARLQLAHVARDLDLTNQQFARAQQERDETQERDRLLRAQLRRLTGRTSAAASVDLAAALTAAGAGDPDTAALWRELLALQAAGPGYVEGGVSPEQGFDSPGLIAYLLARHARLADGPSTLRASLRQRLPSRPQPRVGDVVFYEDDVAMFYVLDAGGRPLVVGMTPVGILALPLDSAPKSRDPYGAVVYAP